jgi:hypothetical protein
MVLAFVTQIWIYDCKQTKKSNENNKPTCIEWALLNPDGKDVLVRLVFLLNKLSVLYPMQSKG